MQLTNYEKQILFRGWVRFTRESIKAGNHGEINKTKITNRIKSNSKLRHLDPNKTLWAMVDEGYLEFMEGHTKGRNIYFKVTYKFAHWTHRHCGILLQKAIIDKLDRVRSKAQKKLDKKYMEEEYEKYHESGMDDFLDMIRTRGHRLMRMTANEADYAFEERFQRTKREKHDSDNEDIVEDSADPYFQEAEVEILEEPEQEKTDKEDDQEVAIESDADADPQEGEIDVDLAKTFLDKFK